MGGIEKTLKIEKAIDWEQYNNKTIYTFDDFKTELWHNHVVDIFDETIIKQDKWKYIFSINGENKFAIDGQINLIQRVQEFYIEKSKNDTAKFKKEVLIKKNGDSLEYITAETTEELNNLRKGIEKNISIIEKSTDMSNIKYHIQRNILSLEDEIKIAKKNQELRSGYDKKDRGYRKIYQSQLQERLDTLYKMKKQIDDMEQNKDKKYTIKRKNKDGINVIEEVKMNDINDFKEDETLKQFRERLFTLENDQPNFNKTRTEIIIEEGDNTPYYEIIINDTKRARQMATALKRINKNYARLDKLWIVGAKRDAILQDLKNLNKYLENYLRNPALPIEPFIPTSGEAFNEFCAIDPDLKNLAKLNKKARKPSNGEANPPYPVGAPNATEITQGGNGQENGTENTRNRKEYIQSSYGDTKEAFEKGGINGVVKHLVDQTNMKPEQKQFWWGVGNLAVIWGMVFVGWKMISSAFKLMTKNGRSEANLWKNLARLGIPTALIFSAQARSGDGPMKIFSGGEITKKIAGIFGGGSLLQNKNFTTQDKETQTKYAEWFPWATALFNGLNYGEMKWFLIQDNKKMKVDPNKYDALINMFKYGPKKNEAAVAFLESIGKDDKKGVINLALTGMGVTREALENNPTKKFNETASEAIARLAIVSNFMDTKGYNKINSETQYLVDKYIREWTDTKELEDLERRGDVFYKETNIQDQTGLATKIKEIAKNNPEKEEQLLLAINTFWNTMPNAPRKIDIIGNGPTVQFKTYDQSSTINLDNKELVGFTPSRFDSYYETFKVANLTNRIKFLCKDKVANTPTPFHISTPGGDIEFANTSLLKSDTEIVSAGRGGSLNKISPILEWEVNKQAYCDYLNSLKFWKTTPTSTN